MKCFAYVRTANRKNKDTSLLIQMEMIKTYIAQNNWKLDSVYTDIGYGNDVNKGFFEMIEDAHKEKSMLLLLLILTNLKKS